MTHLLLVNVAWFISTSIGLIIAMILASTSPNKNLQTLRFSYGTIISMKTYKLSDTAIVSEDGPTEAFKILFSVFLISGLASLGLIYWELSNAKDTLDDDEEDGRDNDEVQEDTERS